MIKTDKIRKRQAAVFYVADYLWGGFAGLGVAMMAVALWSWGSTLAGEFILPAPTGVFTQAVALLRDYETGGLGVSLWRAAAGIGVSLLLGTAAGLLAGSFQTAMAMLKPVITVLLAMPPIIWVVMALFWFGFGSPSVLFTVIIIVTPLTFASAAAGMAGINRQYGEVFDVYRTGRLKKIRYFYLPHLTGYMISSVGVAVAMGVKVVVMAELLGAEEGVGARIADARTMLETSTVMAYVCLIVALAALFEYLVTKPLEILFMPWRR
ncbi:ABC transporter permease [Neisseria sp.]|uniref:ABC transporter permease n=1 Tax=Neisseria sp. TaxID=192066 RepID=UPI0026DDA558|nr:ABC transporter permease subunit [Neisseria sp.]MDO4907570.1 ABC transporter permease subunit [Neisseria sp.]